MKSSWDRGSKCLNILSVLRCECPRRAIIEIFEVNNMRRKSGLSRKQTIGIILIVAAAIHYIPIIKQFSWLGVLTTFIVGIYLIIK